MQVDWSSWEELGSLLTKLYTQFAGHVCQVDDQGGSSVALAACSTRFLSVSLFLGTHVPDVD